MIANRKNKKNYCIPILQCLIVLLSSLFFSCPLQGQTISEQHYRLTQFWETPDVFKTPESVLYDEERECLYVSNYNIKGGFTSSNDTTADEFISKVSLDGNIETLQWVQGLLSPCGMALWNDTLYVVERKRLAAIDIHTGTILNRYTIPGSFFPNDIEFDSDGNAYITDNDNNATTSVFLFKDGQFTPWISSDEILKPNGICITGDKIIVGDARDISIKSIDRNTKEIDTLATLQTPPGQAMFDGLQADGDSGFITSFWDGPAFWISKTGEICEIINTEEFNRANVNNADLVYIPDKQLLIIPTFNDHRLLAYKFSNYLCDYLGQTPPGKTPEVFAPGIVSVNGCYEYGLSISPDGKEIYYTVEQPGDGLTVTKYVNGKWTTPAIANLKGNHSWEFEAFFTPDGEKLYFTSDTNNLSKFWYMEKDTNGWSNAQYLNSPINNSSVMWCTFTNDETIYFGNNDDFKIYRARLKDGQYSEIENMGFRGTHPFVAPDESYFLFNSGNYGGYGNSDIFIVFRKNDGSWTNPVNMGNIINTGYHETCASLSPDGKYIFFSRYNEPDNKSNIYWAKADELIDSLRKTVVSDVLITQDTINITYIGNEGFLISGSTGKILIDAIFTEDWNKYHAPDAETQLKERNAEYPFDNINILLISHNHADHINPDYVTEHIINDPECSLICPQQVKDLISEVDDYNLIENRIFAKDPSGQTRIDTTVNGIPVSIMSFDHADDDGGGTRNLGFIITMNSFKLFHPGDAISNDLNPYQSLNIADDSVDIAFIPRWFFDNEYGDKGPDIIRYIHPKAIIPMHINTSKYDYYRDKASSIQGISPVYFMETSMAEISFKKQSDLSVITGIDHLQNEASGDSLISLFPNPATGQFDISFGTPVREALVEMYDLQGNLVLFETFYKTASATIHFNGLKTGMYLIKIYTDNKIFNKKIILNNKNSQI